MAQTLTINLDTAANRAPVKAAGSADVESGQQSSFISELDRQITQGDSVSSRDKQADAESAAELKDKAEKSEVDDGKILPDEDVEQTQVAESDDAEGLEEEEVVEDADAFVLAASQSESKQQTMSRKGKTTETAQANAQHQSRGERRNSESQVVRNPTHAASEIATETDKPVKNAIRPDILQALNSPNARNQNFVAVNAKTDAQSSTRQLLSLPGATGSATPRTDGPVNLLAPMLTPVVTTGAGNASSASVPLLDVQPTLNNPAWAKVMTSRVSWMAKQGVHQAELRMNPANLGPVEVRLTVQNEQASVTFLAANATTREALEQALPRLRESLSENGLQLTDAEVNDQASDESHKNQEEQKLAMETQFGVLVDDNIEQDDAREAHTGVLTTGVSLYA
ncbi:flagellar hook-length control protein FliK [Methylophaga lonarensis MPL]|uniref:Flagellar hook-length control protein FliK n=1 Tax=Methylophaga lonarensis MPL TaxID=1286106 RepID=M7P1B8_9GAMM|nr:flagellar hook-length control protein FliK [Methylophaga lonarensis]EMR13247.1 flagellar hook-length control protein FliK [Methylophaga lonarensis MPL]